MSIVEKMARAYVEYNRKLHEEAARVEDYENYEWAELGALMAAALTATGLTEAQLEGLANGELVIVPRDPTEKMLEAGRKAWKKPRLHVSHTGSDEFMTCGVIFRAMLAAKEGSNE